MKPKETTTYTLRLDREMLDLYLDLYFKEYPRRRKKPIEEPFVPSLNKYLVMNKDARNELKQHWQDFVYVAAKEQGLLNLQLKRCRVKITYVFGNLRRNDIDNRCPKMVFDGLTFCQTWIDDNRFVIPELHFYAKYEKGNQHMIVEIEALPPLEEPKPKAKRKNKKSSDERLTKQKTSLK